MRGHTVRVGALAVLCGLIPWLALPPPARGERRTVCIELVIEAARYEHLKAMAPQIERALAEEIQPVVKDRFGFVDWNARSELADEPTGTWLLKLEQEDKEFTHGGRTRVLSRFLLAHYADTSEGRVELPQVPQNKTLYDYTTPQAATADGLERDLVAKLREQLTEQLLLGVDDELLDRVSVGNDLRVEEEDQYLVIALKMDELRVREETELKIVFKDAGDNVGRIKVEARGPIAEEPFTGFIKPLVRELEVGDTLLSDPVFWHEDFSSLLSSLSNVNIYITGFKLDGTGGSPTSDGVILDLPDAD